MQKIARDITIFGFKKLWSLAEPLTYIDASKEKFNKEFDANIDFFLVQKFNDLPNNIKHSLFGKEKISRGDITFEWLNKALMPEEVPYAVHRVNDALQGSKYNHFFSRQLIKSGVREQFYTPSTVTIYKSAEQAHAAAAVIKIITEGSGAAVQAERIHSLGEPVWIARDDIKLPVHNATRMFEKHLWNTTVPEEKKAELKEQLQHEVNRRLTKGESWEAFEGVTVFSTLAGRPEVKMYKTVTDKHGLAQDDPEDIKLLGLIKNQQLPNIVSNLPKVPGYTSDGRLLENNSRFLKWYGKQFGEKKLEAFSDVMRSAVGDKVFDFVFNFKLKAAGELMKEEGFGSENSVMANAKALLGIKDYGEVALILVPTFVAYTALHLTLSASVNAINSLTGKKLFDEQLRPVVEEMTDYKFSSATLTKKWVPRVPGKIGHYISSHTEFSVIETGAPDTKTRLLIKTPAFSAHVKNGHEIDINKFTESFVEQCNKSEKLKPLFDKKADFELDLRMYAATFVESVNDAFKAKAPISGYMFGRARKELFEIAANVTTPVYLEASEEVKKLLHKTFVEQEKEAGNIKGK